MPQGGGGTKQTQTPNHTTPQLRRDSKQTQIPNHTTPQEKKGVPSIGGEGWTGIIDGAAWGDPTPPPHGIPPTPPWCGRGLVPLWCGGGFSGVVVGCGFQVWCLTAFPPRCGVPVVWWWVLGLGFRVCTRTPLWCGWSGCGRVYMYRYEMVRVDGQQLGAAQTQTMPHPGECRHFAHATKLHSFKSHTTHEDPGSGVHPCDCWHF